jgi:photosystem II stability/assembly factor-like uncharacterized protein
MKTVVFARRRLLATGLLSAVAGAARAKAFVDPLDAAAVRQNPTSAPLLAMTAAGRRLVGVGLRGVIVVSDDDGVSWRQVAAPVQSDLTALHFPTALLGWVVGHDGVILHSADGGLTWRRQLDGRRSAETFKADYAARFAAGEVAQADVDQLALNYQAGPVLPYLDVWFADELRGWAVGSFGTIAATADGGKTWQAWLHRVANPNYFNLNSIRGVDGDVYMAAEQGSIFRLDRAVQRFSRLDTGYRGSFFGVDGGHGTALAYGLRGTLYRSSDQGRSWAAVATPMPVTVTVAKMLDARNALMGNVAGALFASDDAGRSFRPLPVRADAGLTGVLVVGKNRLVTFGLQGVKLVAYPGPMA